MYVYICLLCAAVRLQYNSSILKLSCLVCIGKQVRLRPKDSKLLARVPGVELYVRSHDRHGLLIAITC